MSAKTESAPPPRWIWALIVPAVVIAVALVIIAVVLLTRTGAGTTSAPTPTPTAVDERAEEAARIIAHPVFETGCAPVVDDEVNRSDDGQSVVLVSHGFGLVSCVLDALDAPDAVYARMEQTRPLDGTLEADWDFVHASWTFDGVDALTVVLEYTGPAIE